MDPVNMIDLQRACAFVHSLIGYEEYGENQAGELSPHAMTCLRVLLGETGVPMADDAWRFANSGKPPVGRDEPMRQLARVLVTVGSVLLEHLGDRASCASHEFSQEACSDGNGVPDDG